MTIVLNTNVLVSALLKPKSHPAHVLNAILNEKLTLLFDNRILEEYQPPEFNNEHAFRRKNIAEFFFFDKKLHISELQWPA